VANFHIELLSQSWIDDKNPELDLCSHGRVFLQIGEFVVPQADDGAWAVSVAALRLMRSVVDDTLITSEMHYDGQQFIPCCAAMYAGDSPPVYVQGCPAGICWSTKHMNDETEIHGLIHTPTTTEAPPPDESVRATIPRREYAHQIAVFSDQVLSFFDASLPKQPEDWQRVGYETFWREFRMLRANLNGILKT